MILIILTDTSIFLIFFFYGRKLRVLNTWCMTLITNMN